jgi:hypothetical protein
MRFQKSEATRERKEEIMDILVFYFSESAGGVKYLCFVLTFYVRFPVVWDLRQQKPITRQVRNLMLLDYCSYCSIFLSSIYLSFFPSPIPCPVWV